MLFSSLSVIDEALAIRTGLPLQVLTELFIFLLMCRHLITLDFQKGFNSLGGVEAWVEKEMEELRKIRSSPFYHFLPDKLSVQNSLAEN